MSFSLSEPDPAVLEPLLREQSVQPFSYPDVGATGGRRPKGYRHVRHEIELGHGDEVFERASDGLYRWQAHLRAGARAHAEHGEVDEGTTVVLAVPVAFVWVTVACRVVYVTREQGRRGFAYGTLPHHVIDGEEAFLVERDDAQAVRFVVSAFLRPRGRFMSLCWPLVHLLDERIVQRYLHGLRAYASGAESTGS